MKIILRHFRELLSLTQLYLHREYPLKAYQTADPALFSYFRNRGGNSPLGNQNNPSKMLTSLKPTVSAPLKPPPQASTSSVTLPPNLQLPQTLQTEANLQTHDAEIKVEKTSNTSQAPLNQNQSTKQKIASKSFALESFSPQAPQDLTEFGKLYRQLFPEIPLIETIPNDSFAIKIKNAWVNEQTIPPVIILSFRNQDKELAFLKNVAQAITLRLAPARVISALNWEKEKGWEEILNSPDLKLFIACDYDLYLQPALMKVYQEAPQQGKHYLSKTPLLLLSDLSLYLKEPQMKSLLWRAICNEFAS